MPSVQEVVAATSSTALRVLAFIFLRWIPGGQFPEAIATCLTIYLTSIWLISRKRSIDHAVERGPARSSQKATVNNGKSNGTTDGKRQSAKQRSVLRTLLFGLPSSKSWTWSSITIGTNIILALLTFDYVLRPVLLYPADDLHFSRVGHVSPTTAKILVREPREAELPLHVYYRASSKPEADWVLASTVAVNETTDFTAAVLLDHLEPSTEYEYYTQSESPRPFRTAPAPGSDAATRLSFVSSSCLKPNFPYNLLSHPLRLPGVEFLSSAISERPPLTRPSFMLFLGDFIYIDVPMRLGSSVAHYRSEYRRVYSSPTWNEPHEVPAIDLPWIHVLDDHEIANDWAEGNVTAPYPAAAEPYTHYHASVNPPIADPSFASPSNTTYFSFTHGPASFFLVDTRTFRSRPAQDNSTMLGSAQLRSLLAWIARPEPAGVRWKIVASSVPFSKNWHVGTHDTWGGFLQERRTVFDAMWQAERDLGVRIVLLSGDRHEFAATRFPEPDHEDKDGGSGAALFSGPGTGLHEFSVSPLSMFYLPVRTYWATDDDDVAVKYAPDGNSKFGAIDIEPDEASRLSVLTYSLYVDGKAVWKYRLSVPLAGAEVEDRAMGLPPGEVVLDEVRT